MDINLEPNDRTWHLLGQLAKSAPAVGKRISNETITDHKIKEAVQGNISKLKTDYSEACKAISATTKEQITDLPHLIGQLTKGHAQRIKLLHWLILKDPTTFTENDNKVLQAIFDDVQKKTDEKNTPFLKKIFNRNRTAELKLIKDKINLLLKSTRGTRKSSIDYRKNMSQRERLYDPNEIATFFSTKKPELLEGATKVWMFPNYYGKDKEHNVNPIKYTFRDKEYSFKTSEHLFQFLKVALAGDMKLAEKVAKAKTPGESKKLANKAMSKAIKNGWADKANINMDRKTQLFINQFFDNYYAQVIDKRGAVAGHDKLDLAPFELAQIKEFKIQDAAMLLTVLERANANPEFADALIDSGEALLIENTEQFDDTVWGCGKEGNGQNRFGMALMLARAMLKGDIPKMETSALAEIIKNPKITVSTDAAKGELALHTNFIIKSFSKEDLHTEGLGRISGDKKNVDLLANAFLEQGSQPKKVLENKDVHDRMSLLKKLWANPPTQYCDILKNDTLSSKDLSDLRRSEDFESLITLLRNIYAEKESNKMISDNLAKIFAAPFAGNNLQALPKVLNNMKYLIENWELIIRGYQQVPAEIQNPRNEET